MLWARHVRQHSVRCSLACRRSGLTHQSPPPTSRLVESQLLAVSGFKSELSDWFDLVKSSEVTASDYGELDPEVEEQLRALGYLD